MVRGATRSEWCAARVCWARTLPHSLWEELHMQGQALARAGRWSLALLLFITSTAAAQVRISGGISGTVSDQSGGVVPGATVQLKDEGTGNPRETITNDAEC